MLSSETKKSQAVGNSTRLFERAQKVIPGGVNSPVRAFGSIGGTPRFIARGAGSRVWDEEGNSYIDYVCSWGALPLGHAHPTVVEAAEKALRDGSTFGAATAREVELAETITAAIPSIEKVRLVSSGTEATMTAVRLARAFTKRNKILKFEGCYHGHADPFLVKAGSGLLTHGNPSSQGIPKSVTDDTLVASYNDVESLEQVFTSHGKELACVIVEPVAGNMGVVPPRSGFLQKLREICTKHSVVLIFDEVITGFRFHYGGYQDLCHVRPDLTTLGKIIGGGMPLAAVGGRAEILDLLAPLGPVYQAGTLSGNPVATAAGIATLQLLQDKNIYAKLETLGAKLADGLKNPTVAINRIGSMLSAFFNEGPVETYEQVMASDREPYKRLFHRFLDRGIYLPPSPFEAWFISAAHTEKEIEETINGFLETNNR